jgi:hypothetical protein
MPAFNPFCLVLETWQQAYACIAGPWQAETLLSLVGLCCSILLFLYHVTFSTKPVLEICGIVNAACVQTHCVLIAERHLRKIKMDTTAFRMERKDVL